MITINGKLFIFKSPIIKGENSKEQKKITVTAGIDLVQLRLPMPKLGQGEEADKSASITWLAYIYTTVKADPAYKLLQSSANNKPSKYAYRPHGKTLFSLIWGGCYKSLYAKLEFNPSKLTDVEWQSMVYELSWLFPHTGAKHELLNSRIAHIEFFVDIKNVKHSEVMTLSTKHTTHTTYKVNEATYMGKRSSAMSVVQYDKRKELIDKKHPDPGHELTRIEIRLKPENVAFADVKSLLKSDLKGVQFFTGIFRHNSVSGKKGRKEFGHSRPDHHITIGWHPCIQDSLQTRQAQSH